MSSSTMNTSNPINPSDLFSAKDLVIVITGGGSGIGLAFTTALASTSARAIYILGRRPAPLQEAANSTNPSIVHPITCDISSPSSLQSAVSEISQRTPYIDVLINNAGINGPLTPDLSSAATIADFSAIMTRDWEGWGPTFAINTAAVVGVSAAFLGLLAEGNARRGWGRAKVGLGEVRRREEGGGWDASDQRTSQIVTVASISAFNREVTAGLAYTASKAGAVAVGKSLSFHLAPWGIRSNVIAPGRFPSEMTAGGTMEFPVGKLPHGAPGTYEDLAAVILNLVGRGGAYLNGAVQVVDGGRLAQMPGTF